MSANRGQQRSAQGAPGGSYSHPGQRVSDADRAEAAERLSQQYGEGRLDQAEFDRRLDQAMHATTHADLNALFSDLPGGQAQPGHAPDSYIGHRRHRLGMILLAVVAVVIVMHALSHIYIPLLIIAVVAIVLMRGNSRRYRRY